MTSRLGPVLLVLSIGCGGGGSSSDGGMVDGGVDPRQLVVELPATPNRELDLLFVIDDSPSMIDKQSNLIANFPTLVNLLQSTPGGLPDLHLGVITTDMGTKGSESASPGPSIGQVGAGGCANIGKGGNLQIGAAQISGTFLSDIKQTDGSRLRNYTGDLATTFGAMARVGASGCGFEQPLAAMRAALGGNAANAGFLRPAALLGVVFLTDEDDCSVRTPTLFGPESEALGPLQSFRCTRYGVTCATGGATPDAMNQVGAKSGCTASTGSPYLDDVAPYRDFLLGLKGGDASRIVVGGIAGNTEPLAVELRAGPGGGAPIPALAHSCTYNGANGAEVADPGVRMQTFLAQFPNRSALTSICQQDLSGGLAVIEQVLRRAIGSSCVSVALRDVDPAQAGLQVDCIVEDVVGAVATRIEPCGATGPATCWRLEANPTMCTAADNLQLVVTRPQAPDPTTVTRMRCLLP